MMLAIVADALQIVVFPLFVEGALSPVDDMLDFKKVDQHGCDTVST